MTSRDRFLQWLDSSPFSWVLGPNDMHSIADAAAAIFDGPGEAVPGNISNPLADMFFRKVTPALTQEQALSAAALVLGEQQPVAYMVHIPGKRIHGCDGELRDRLLAGTEAGAKCLVELELQSCRDSGEPETNPVITPLYAGQLSRASLDNEPQHFYSRQLHHQEAARNRTRGKSCIWRWCLQVPILRRMARHYRRNFTD